MSEWTAKFCSIALALTLIVAVLVSGSTHPETISILGLLAFFCALTGLVLSKSNSFSFPRRLYIFLGFLFGGSILQWVPLSAGWIQFISPETYIQWSLAHRGLQTPEDITWSLAPALSYHRSLQYFVLLICLTLVSVIGSKSQREPTVYRPETVFIYVSALLGAGIAYCEIFEVRLFQYGTIDSWRGFGPFINSNHAGGFCALLAMWLLHCSQKSRGPLRWFGISVSFAFTCFVALSLSRGAMLALLCGFAFSMIVPVQCRRKLPLPSILILITTSFLFLLAAYLERDALVPVLRELGSLKDETGASKLTPWKVLPELLMRYPIGTGLGGLYGTLPQFDVPLTTSGRIFFLENQFLQIFSDWGLTLGIGVFLGFCSILVPLCRRRYIQTNPFFFAGLVVLLVHNLVDFNSSLLSIQIVVLIGYVLYLKRHPRPRDHLTLNKASCIWAISVGIVVCSVGALRYGVEGMPVKYGAFADSIQVATNEEGIQTSLSQYKIGHPLDGFADLLSAQKLFQLKATGGRVLARINTAMTLQPHFAQSHLLASEVLLAYGRPEQAIVEFLLAFRKNDYVARHYSSRHFKRLASISMAKRAVSLPPALRYQLWGRLKAHGIFVPELILADEDWLEEPSFLNLRSESYFAIGKPQEVINLCSRWELRYPGYQTCRTLRFRALEAMGESEEVLASLKELWAKNRFDGRLAWAYLSRLRGKTGCKEFLETLDLGGALIQFNEAELIDIKKRELNCVILLGFKNRYANLVQEHLGSDSTKPDILRHVLRSLRKEQPLSFERICVENSVSFKVLGFDNPCSQ